MRLFTRALWAEIGKYRRTAALWLTLGIPLLVTGLVLLILTLSNLAERTVEQRWDAVQQILFGLWVNTCLPIGAAILTGLIWGLEHSSGHLKHVMSLPPSRTAVFLAKSTGIVGLLACGTAFLGVLMTIATAAIGMTPLRPDVVFGMPFTALVGALPAIALVSWVAQRCTAFAWPMILGVAGLIIGSVGMQSEEYWSYIPWAWSPLAASIGAPPDVARNALLLALGGGAVLLAGSWVHFRRADAPC